MEDTPAKRTPRYAAPIAAGMAVLTLVATAWAQPGQPRRETMDKRCMRLHYERHLKPYDTDKNGHLDRQEHRAMRRAQHADALANYDANQDGKLDKKEREKLHFAKLVEHFEEMDANGNAEISRDEAKLSCMPLADHFDRADVDGNGIVTWTEFEDGAKRARRHGPGMHPPPPRFR